MEHEIRSGEIGSRHIGLTIRWEAADGRSGSGVLVGVVKTSVAKYLRFDSGESVAYVLPRTTIFGRTKEWRSNPRFWQRE